MSSKSPTRNIKEAATKITGIFRPILQDVSPIRLFIKGIVMVRMIVGINIAIPPIRGIGCE